MLSFDIKKSTRKCFESGKAFSPGEIFFSALIELEDGQTERRDFCREHWTEPAEDCVGWWKAQVPDSDKGKVYWAPRKVLLAYFEHVLDQPGSLDIAYLTCLMLVQKKILVMEEELDNGTKVRLRNRMDRTTYDVEVFELEENRLAEIQEILAEQLFMDEPVDDSLDKDELDD